jgi:hypothetical protein
MASRTAVTQVNPINTQQTVTCIQEVGIAIIKTMSQVNPTFGSRLTEIQEVGIAIIKTMTQVNPTSPAD